MALEIKTTPLLKEYFTLQKKYQEKYGENTVVVMEVGSFFEIYEIEDYELGKAKEVSDILNIQITKKRKADPHSPKNPYMIGFPNYCVLKFVKRLIHNEFTVVKFDQEDIPDSDRKKRKLDRIYSPGTYVEQETPNTNYIVCVILEESSSLKYGYISAIDLSTGKAHVFETHDRLDDVDRAENEIFRFIHSHNPTEVLLTNPNRKWVEIFKLGNKIVHFREIPNTYKQISYQSELLKKVYGKTSLSPIEYIGLETYPDLVLSFILLLQFAYEHDPSVIKRIQIPDMCRTDNTLILNRDSIFQLNVISTTDRGKFSSLFNLVNFTNTNMGRRLLQERLLLPLSDVKKLKKRYTMVSELLTDNNYQQFETILREIVDLEKKHRKAILKKLTPYEFSSMNSSYQSVDKLFSLPFPNRLSELVQKRFREFCEKIDEMFELEKMGNIYSIADLKTSIFKPDQFPNIDSIQVQISELYSYFEQFRLFLSKTADPKKPKDSVKLSFNEVDGYHFQTTKRRYDRIKEMDDLEGRLQKNIVKITTLKMKEKSRECRHLENKIGKLVQTQYINSLYKLYLDYKKTLKRIVNFVAELDVICSSAKSARKYAYSCPEIVESDRSFLEYKGLRHPIVERIIDTEYIDNDLSLGATSELRRKSFRSSGKNGILLYGLNAVGKSCCLKAVGANIILAQAGMFVACANLRFSPYTLLFSKISSNDNLFRGQSTFVAEMSELRGILRGSNERSLILADELCSGTESLSATSILASTLLELDRKRSCFLFSTHLHSLLTLEEIKNLEGLQIYHFKVSISSSGDITYDRKLQKGGGETLYGLEIAKSLNIGSSFIRRAFDIRASLQKQGNYILSTKKSRYNTKKYVHTCERCGKGMKEVGHLHTHHKIHQKDSDKYGIVNDKFHKNSKHNLEILCETCHIEEHNL